MPAQPSAEPTAEPTMLLVHSPLLTPATWDALEPHLEAAGWRVTTPDLRPLIEAPSFHAAVCAAATNVTASAVVGHSRAGAYLPGIAEAIGGNQLDVVLLDARLPHPGMSWVGSLPPERATWLRQMVRSGRLPPWDTWSRRIYLQLSAEYQSTAEQAEELGYLVRRRDADHLAMITQPAMIADLLLSAIRDSEPF